MRQVETSDAAPECTHEGFWVRELRFQRLQSRMRDGSGHGADCRALGRCVKLKPRTPLLSVLTKGFVSGNFAFSGCKAGCVMVRGMAPIVGTWADASS